MYRPLALGSVNDHIVLARGRQGAPPLRARGWLKPGEGPAWAHDAGDKVSQPRYQPQEHHGSTSLVGLFDGRGKPTAYETAEAGQAAAIVFDVDLDAGTVNSTPTQLGKPSREPPNEASPRHGLVGGPKDFPFVTPKITRATPTLTSVKPNKGDDKGVVHLASMTSGRRVDIFAAPATANKAASKTHRGRPDLAATDGWTPCDVDSIWPSPTANLKRQSVTTSQQQCQSLRRAAPSTHLAREDATRL